MDKGLTRPCKDLFGMQESYNDSEDSVTGDCQATLARLVAFLQEPYQHDSCWSTFDRMLFSTVLA